MGKIDTLVKVIDYVKRHPNPKAEEVAKAVGITSRYAQQVLKEVNLLSHHFSGLTLGKEDIRIILANFRPNSQYEMDVYRRLSRSFRWQPKGVLRMGTDKDRPRNSQLNIGLTVTRISRDELDPATAYFITPLIYERLIWIDGDGNTEYRLAEGLQPVWNYRRWIIRLRKGILWSDGTQITQEDVVSSIESSSLMPRIQLIMTRGLSEIDITLKRQDPLFNYRLASLTVLPADPSKNRKVVSGAYMFKMRQRRTGFFRFKPNPFYYREDRPIIPSISIREYLSFPSNLRAFLKKKVDIIPSIYSLRELYQIDSTLTPQSWRSHNSYFALLLNKNGKFADNSLAEAFKQAIDYQGINLYVSEGGGWREQVTLSERMDVRVGYMYPATDLIRVTTIVQRSISDDDPIDVSGLSGKEIREKLDCVCLLVIFGRNYMRLKEYFHSQGRINIFGYNNRIVDAMLDELDKVRIPIERRRMGDEIIQYLQADGAMILLTPHFDYYLSNLQVELDDPFASIADFVYQLPNIVLDRNATIADYSHRP